MDVKDCLSKLNIDTRGIEDYLDSNYIDKFIKNQINNSLSIFNEVYFNNTQILREYDPEFKFSCILKDNHVGIKYKFYDPTSIYTNIELSVNVYKNNSMDMTWSAAMESRCFSLECESIEIIPAYFKDYLYNMTSHMHAEGIVVVTKMKEELS